MATTPELSELEKQQLLGMDLDSFEDLPEFVNPPNGTYICSLGKKELKKVGENPSVGVNFNIVSLAELSNPAEAAEVPKENDIMSMLFNLANEYGRGNLKKITAALKESHGVSTLDDFLKLPDGSVMCAVTVKRTKQVKDGQEKTFTNLVNFVVQ